MATLEKNIMRPRRNLSFHKEDREFDEKVLEVSRVSRVVKGGRRIRFRVLVVVGDRKGKIGLGIGKANEVSIAVQKATTKAKKHIILVPIINGTIPYKIIATHGASRVLLKPAAPGSSIIAGGPVRSIADLAGITDIIAKILGSESLINNAFAVFNGLSSFNPKIVDKIKAYAEKSESKATVIVSNQKSDNLNQHKDKHKDKPKVIKPKKIESK